MRGQVRHLQISLAGMPKDPVERVMVRAEGIDGDRQRNLKHHGGPRRAVSLLGVEVIEEVAAEGHPIRPGSTGENMTLGGLPWTLMQPGARLAFDGGVRLELTDYAAPCVTIAASFADGRFGRLSTKSHPGSSRIYARVLVEGLVAVGEGVELETVQIALPLQTP